LALLPLKILVNTKSLFYGHKQRLQHVLYFGISITLQYYPYGPVSSFLQFIYFNFIQLCFSTSINNVVQHSTEML